jgi:malate dehydrogenase (oxaloacetate-decarboxylating)(NADP+)
VLRACRILIEEEVCHPIVLGDPDRVRSKAEEIGVSTDGIEIVDIRNHPARDELAERLYTKRARKGMTITEAKYIVGRHMEYFGALMVELGHADGLINGLTRRHPDALRPMLHVIDRREGVRTICSMFIVLTKSDVYFFADTAINIDPSAEDLAEIALSTARAARYFNVDPRVAMLSFSNFGTVRHERIERIHQAIAIARDKEPDLVIDGEMQADTAVTPALLKEFPFNTLRTPANVLIFPDLASGNIAYKLLRRLGGAQLIGPITLGFEKPVNVLHFSCDVNDVVSAAAVAAIAAMEGPL